MTGRRLHSHVVALVALLVGVAMLLGACSGARPAPPSTPTPRPALTPTPLAVPGPFALDAPTDWRGGEVPATRLPAEARETLALIATGGPYPYRQDDGVFGNREGILPDRPSGYYREYTVETPGSPDRGARRIVVGDGVEAYYTDDHYASFRFVLP